MDMTDERKISSAMRLLSEPSSGVLKLDDTFEDKLISQILDEKHPKPAPPSSDALLSGTLPPQPHPVKFSALDLEMIRRAALNTYGAAGPSGVDAEGWRWMCTSFSDASDSLCDALASSARRLATQYIDPSSLDAFVASRLIPLDKNPGVRPIGIGEVIRRIVGKSILYIIGRDIQEAAGSLQLCAGQDCGIEAAIHAMQQVYDLDNTEAVLMADATNAFNMLNRNVCLRNMRYLCPALATVVINTYRHPAKLFVDGTFILSSEGVTQGDPIAMPMYAIGILPLLRSLAFSEAIQMWYADDSSAGGKLRNVRTWWDMLSSKGPPYGYQVNPCKSVLVVKPAFMDEAKKMFANTDVRITAEGSRFLGAAIGSTNFKKDYLMTKVNTWLAELNSFIAIAKSQPQVAYIIVIPWQPTYVIVVAKDC